MVDDTIDIPALYRRDVQAKLERYRAQYHAARDTPAEQTALWWLDYWQRQEELHTPRTDEPWGFGGWHE